jgi:hypothetical protein
VAVAVLHSPLQYGFLPVVDEHRFVRTALANAALPDR